jgi:hypothetical protein
MAIDIGGPLCKNCGWQEIPHTIDGGKVTGGNDIRRGYKHTLVQCVQGPGFKPCYPWLWRKLAALIPND